jgi:hypothetical protein
MDGLKFDTLVQLVTTAASRRSLLKSALVPAVAGIGAATLLVVDEVDAKKKHKKKKCRKPGSPCSSNKQCCTSKTQNICDVPTNASNSDHTCCGANGAKCGGVNEDGDALPPFCCIGEAGVNEFICSQNDPGTPNTPGTCQPAPPDM